MRTWLTTNTTTLGLHQTEVLSNLSQCLCCLDYAYSDTPPGTQNGAVWLQSGSFENYMAKLRAGKTSGRGRGRANSTLSVNTTSHASRSAKLHSRASSYWLPELAPLGKQPTAGADYKVYRDVVKDYDADNTGETDTTEAINAAIQDGDRCGKECGNTFSQGAVIYFPVRQQCRQVWIVI